MAVNHVEGWESVGEILPRVMSRETVKPRPKAGRTRLGLSVLGAVLLVQVIVAIAMLVAIPEWIGHDFTVYRDAAERWLSGGSYFHPYQLQGPYPVVADEVLYPPVALLLFAPFVYLPAPLWVLIPLGVIGWIVWSSRPSVLGWVAVLFLVTFPQWRPMSWTLDLIGNGNPVLWAAMFVALATRFPVFGPFAWLKPTPLLIPFGLIGIRQRAWWVGLAILIALSLPFLPLCIEYLTVLRNARGVDALYAMTSVPLVLVASSGYVMLTTRAASVKSATAPRTPRRVRAFGCR